MNPRSSLCLLNIIAQADGRLPLHEDQHGRFRSHVFREFMILGKSEGNFKISDKKTLEFFGTLSLANHRGFASVRSKAKKAQSGERRYAGCQSPWRWPGIFAEPFTPTSNGRLTRIGPQCKLRKTSGSKSKSRSLSFKRLRLVGWFKTPVW
jgi:hypothetical protein